MTTTYEATDKNCTHCGRPVEDYTGHSQASEVTLCEVCHPEHADEWERPGRVVHNVPREYEHIHDIDRHDYSSNDRVSLDFKVDVPKLPERTLPSSATIEGEELRDFEIRLGLLSKDEYDPEGIEAYLIGIAEGVGIPEPSEKYLPPDEDVEITQQVQAKIGYDPAWGEVGYYQIHLTGHSFFPPQMSEAEFLTFADEVAGAAIDLFEWDDE